MNKSKSEDPASVRDQLIEGTVRWIDEEGVSDLSVRALAAASGRSTMCIYSKFKNRQALLEAVHQVIAADFLDALAGATTPAELVGMYWKETFERRGRYVFLFGPEPAAMGLTETFRAHAAGLVLDRFSQVTDRPRPLWALVHGWAGLHATAPTSTDLEDCLAEAAKISNEAPTAEFSKIRNETSQAGVR